MIIKVLYRRNLKMSPGKLAAQVGHAVLGLKDADKEASIRVLEMSDKKFYEYIEFILDNNVEHYRVFDAGKTEVRPGTETCVAFIEGDTYA